MHKITDAPVNGLVINEHFPHILRKRITDNADDEVSITVEQAGALALDIETGHQGMPELCQILHILSQSLFAGSGRHGTHDNPHALRADFSGKRVKPCPLLFIVNPPRHTDVGSCRQQHHMTSRQGDVGGSPWAFAAAGILDYLHRQLLADMNFLRPGQSLPHISRQTVTNEHKGILSRADIHKGRLHPRQHILYLPLVNIAYQMGMSSPLHLQSHKLPVFHHRRPCLLRHNSNKYGLHPHTSPRKKFSKVSGKAPTSPQRPRKGAKGL